MLEWTPKLRELAKLEDDVSNNSKHAISSDYDQIGRIMCSISV